MSLIAQRFTLLTNIEKKMVMCNYSGQNLCKKLDDKHK